MSPLPSPSSHLDFRLIFPYHFCIFPSPSSRKTFVVTCKRCRRDVPSGVREFPFQSITVACPLCGELRRYLPSEVFLGQQDGLVNRQQRGGGR
jgi:hypothetical protein